MVQQSKGLGPAKLEANLVHSSTSCVRPSVVVLKNFSTKVHCGQHVWFQNLISVSSGAKVAVDVHQLSFSAYDIAFVDDLDRRVRIRQPAPQTLQELQQVLEQEWGRIPQDRI
jgi:hypothetical protein